MTQGTIYSIYGDNCMQVEIEACALRWGLDYFRYYLEGIHHVICFVDCKPLLPLFNHDNRECPPRIMRQKLAVQDLPIELVHIDGKKMPADFLSRERTTKMTLRRMTFVTWK